MRTTRINGRLLRQQRASATHVVYQRSRYASLALGYTPKVWVLHADNAETALAKRDEYLKALERESGSGQFDRFVAALIFTELVGNVVRHAGGPVDVRLYCKNGDAKLQVIDSGRGFTLRRSLPKHPLDDHGRGLYLVSRFSKDLSVQALRYGTCVSAVFPL